MASPIQATGLGSSLDVNGLVTKLMDVEKQPLTKLDQKEAAVQLKISSFGTFRGSVSAFQGSLSALEQSSLYTSNKGTIVDPNVATVSAGTNADLGSHTLEVTNLAVAQRLKSGTFKSLTDAVGTGTLTIQFGTVTQADDGNGGTTTSFAVNAKKATKDITIDTAHNTLAGVRDQINAAKAGVTASIVNDGTGFRLVVASNDTGTENSIKISASDDDTNNTDALGLSQLAYDPTAAAGSGMNMTQVIAAEDATFNLDGLAITKASNTVSDVLSGTTLTLLKTNVGAPTELTVAQDTSGVKTAVDAFVKAYNELDTTVDKLTGYDASTKTGGVLQGDASVRSIMGQIRDGLSSVVSSAGGSYTGLAQIGITVDRSGQLQVNAAKLQTALSANPTAVRGLFATGGSTQDSLVSYVRSSVTTPAGTYALNVSQLATQGSITGSVAANLNINSANDGLTVTVNGTTTTVNLTQKTYADAASLAAEVQSQLNSSSAFLQAGVTVSATTDPAGHMTLTSNSYGSTSKIVMGGNTAQNEMFGTAAVTTDGVDVGGTLGGTSAIGSGQTLTSSNGLAVSIAGGATGERGNVFFTRGIAVQLDSLLTKALGNKGTISAATDGLQGDVKDIDAQREKLNAQLEVKQQRYTDQFNTLDGLITSMQSTMSYLAQQLASLNNK